MRPKKRILLIDAIEPRLSVRRYLLTTLGYRVFGAGSAEEALAIAAEHYPEMEAAVLVWPLKGARDLLTELHARCPSTSTMLLAEGLRELPDSLFPDCILYGRIHANDFLDRLKMLAARKRGPKKKPVQSVSVEDAAARRIA